MRCNAHGPLLMIGARNGTDARPYSIFQRMEAPQSKGKDFHHLQLERA